MAETRHEAYVKMMIINPVAAKQTAVTDHVSCSVQQVKWVATLLAKGPRK
jgi:hypothetical protein